MQETLRDHHTSISIGGGPICNLRFADDIDLTGGSNGELKDLTNRLVERATAYGMEISTEKRKLMTNSTNIISADVTTNGQKLEEAWFVHVTRHDSLSKTILQGTLEAGRRRGRQRKCWTDNIKEWTSLPMPELTGASCKKDLKRVSASCPPPHPLPDYSIGQGTELNCFNSLLTA